MDTLEKFKKMLKQLEKKTLYFERFSYLFSKYSQIIFVDTEKINSNQFKKCRKALGKNSILVLGKNKIVKKVLKSNVKKNPELEKLMPYLKGNIGFIFTTISPIDVKKILIENQEPAPAKAGQIAPDDVIIPAGLTGITPDGTSLFQALNIQTKISKGLIEIQNPVKIITKGQLIGNSEVILLQKLNITPFSYKLDIKLIFENKCCIKPEILDISSEEIEEIVNKKKIELKILESFFCYPNSIKIENQMKIVETNLAYLSAALGYTTFSSIKKNEILDTQKKDNSSSKPKDLDSQKISEKNETETEDEDMGFGLFD